MLLTGFVFNNIPTVTNKSFVFFNIPGPWASFPELSFVFIDIPGSFLRFKDYDRWTTQLNNDILSICRQTAASAS